MTDGDDPRERLERIAGLSLDHMILERALTHRSYAYENGGLPTNERLEFLGDAVLGVIVTETLFRSYPDLPEGQLAKLRAAVVNMRALADVSRALGLGDYLRLGRGEESTGGRDKSSILADALEALIGAVYVDGGLAAATEFVHRLFDDVIADAARLGAGLDWKTSLQELTASMLLGVPFYEVSESGPDHEKTFTAEVRVGGTVYGSGFGRSKKEAEQQAAAEAWNKIRQRADAEQQAGGQQSNTGQSNTGQSNTGQSNTGQSNTGQSDAGQSNAGQSNTGQRTSADQTEPPSDGSAASTD